MSSWCFFIFLICDGAFHHLWSSFLSFSTMFDKKFIFNTHYNDGGESSMSHNTWKTNPPLPKPSMLRWWHKVHVKEKGKTMLPSTLLCFGILHRSGQRKLLRLMGCSRCILCFQGVSINPSTNACAMIKCVKSKSSWIDIFGLRLA